VKLGRRLCFPAAIAAGLWGLTGSGPAVAAPGAVSIEAADSLFTARDWKGAAEAYGAVLADEPGLGMAWFRLAGARYQLGEYADAAAAYARADSLGIFPAVTRYNLACSLALAGEVEPAFEALGRAVDLGFTTPETMGADTDLAALHDDPRWTEMLDRADRAARPCEHDPRYRRFDFWIGEWDVFVQGRPAGTSRIDPLLDGCALLENWTGRQGLNGKSLNYLDPVTGKWKQTWVNDNGGILEYEETADAPTDASIRFLAHVPKPDGSETLRRMTFTAVAPDSVRQFMEQSEDGGATWTPSFDGMYVRRK
jgi:hypothetical protein